LLSLKIVGLDYDSSVLATSPIPHMR
jgi:hypothetical protein